MVKTTNDHDRRLACEKKSKAIASDGLRFLPRHFVSNSEIGTFKNKEVSIYLSRHVFHWDDDLLVY